MWICSTFFFAQMRKLETYLKVFTIKKKNVCHPAHRGSQHEHANDTFIPNTVSLILRVYRWSCLFYQHQWPLRKIESYLGHLDCPFGRLRLKFWGQKEPKCLDSNATSAWWEGKSWTECCVRADWFNDAWRPLWLDQQRVRASSIGWVDQQLNAQDPAGLRKKKKEHTDKTETRVRLASAALVAMCELHM